VRVRAAHRTVASHFVSSDVPQGALGSPRCTSGDRASCRPCTSLACQQRRPSAELLSLDRLCLRRSCRPAVGAWCATGATPRRAVFTRSPSLYQEPLRAKKRPLEIKAHATPRQWLATSCGRALTRWSRHPSVVGSRIPRKGTGVVVRCQRFTLGCPPAGSAVGHCLRWLGGEQARCRSGVHRCNSLVPAALAAACPRRP
jgi:hypothetical protein